MGNIDICNDNSLNEIYLRFNTKNDLDLLCLYDAGYNLSSMLMSVLTSFANGNPCKIVANNMYDIDVSKTKDYRIHLYISKDDMAVRRLIKSVKPSYRNIFYKVLLRNSLVKSNIRQFFENDDYNDTIRNDWKMTALTNNANYIDIDDFKRSKKAKSAVKILEQKEMRSRINSTIVIDEIDEDSINVSADITTPQTSTPVIAVLPLDKTTKNNDVEENIVYNINVDSSDMNVTDAIDEYAELFG